MSAATAEPAGEGPGDDAPRPRRGLLRLKLAILAACALIPPGAITAAVYADRESRRAAARESAIADEREALATTYLRIGSLSDLLEQARRVKRPANGLTSDDVLDLVSEHKLTAVEAYPLLMALDTPLPEDVERQRAAEIDAARRHLATLAEAGIPRDDAERTVLASLAASGASAATTTAAVLDAIDLVRTADALPPR